jgi:hypothetical protein
MAILPLLLAYNTRGSSQAALYDDDDRQNERRRIAFVIVIWPIWAAAWLLAYCTLMAP